MNIVLGSSDSFCSYKSIFIVCSIYFSFKLQENKNHFRFVYVISYDIPTVCDCYNKYLLFSQRLSKFMEIYISNGVSKIFVLFVCIAGINHWSEVMFWQTTMWCTSVKWGEKLRKLTVIQLNKKRCGTICKWSEKYWTNRRTYMLFWFLVIWLIL